MKLNDKRYFLIFDTNILFQSYKNHADFTHFSLNSVFQEAIGMVNQLDIYENVEIAISSVVWNELKKQIIAAHEERIIEFEKWNFPEYAVKKLPVEDYSIYIEKRIDEYKKSISSGINKIIELPIPTEKRFEKIVKRAFEKEAPFEGKDKKSDKGFKDVLIWESILELTEDNPKAQIIFYSEDKGFKEKLVTEFMDLFPEACIYIYSKKDDVKEQLQIWAKEIDKYSYRPIEDFDENAEIVDWLNSEDFIEQIIDGDFGLVEKGRLISSISANLVSVDNIECLNINENSKEYYIELVLEVKYNLKDGAKTSETIGASVRVEEFDDIVYSVEDAYRTENNETEREI